jgi:hypothetical protein
MNHMFSVMLSQTGLFFQYLLLLYFTIQVAYLLFFSIAGPRRNGHLFIDELYKKGVRNFAVDFSFSNQIQEYPLAKFLNL